MTPAERAELEDHQSELQRLASQNQSLRSALIISSNCIADLLRLADEQRPDHRERARSRVADALSEINRHLSGSSFSSEAHRGGAKE